MTKRIMFVILAFALVAGVSFAYRMPSKGEVNCSALNVRTGPGLTYSVLTTISQGTQVQILSISGNWYKVNVGSNNGVYVHSSYIKVTESIDVNDPKAEKEATKRFLPTLQNVDPSTR
ncbi:MAG TPA: SH3 domain-containing protein [Candidatus Rifleibacterium sp.]|nr:SH3 domain-containing protein [Candidatus Rifleibacterium sp.]HPT44828.1 SH3 domain-containing protein [Candidatus Rifleibacterium sp.]